MLPTENLVEFSIKRFIINIRGNDRLVLNFQYYSAGIKITIITREYP